MMRNEALKSDVKARRCPRTKTWLFPIDWATDFIGRHCLTMIADHIDQLNRDQKVLPFGKPRLPMKGDAPEAGVSGAAS